MFVIDNQKEVSEKRKEEIRQLFTIMLMTITTKDGEMADDIHPVDFASYIIFLCLTVWKSHTKEPGFMALANVLVGELTFTDFPDFWETIMDDDKSIMEARKKTPKLDLLEVTKPDKKDIN